MIATDSNVSEMVITHDATIARDATLPVSGAADSKTELLRKLQGTMHFEKTVTALSSMIGHDKKSKLVSSYVSSQAVHDSIHSIAVKRFS